ncbi:MAG: hypothetical protein JNM61_04160 [Zoogloeaceae bacterium]|nr:hypothetical protein [Zoogloeaceae bacterium]
MGKLLLFVAILVGVYLLRRALAKPPERARGGPAPRGPAADPGAERMVACDHCGVHFPESEAVSAGGRVYCCEQHRQAGQSRG